jgi:hypothetical protein
MLRQWRLWWLLLVQVLLDVPPAGRRWCLSRELVRRRRVVQEEAAALAQAWWPAVARAAEQLHQLTEQLEHRLVRQWPHD